MTVKEICENIWELEEKNDLFNQKIQEVYFWKLIRFSLFRKITEKKGIYGQAHTKVKTTLKDRLLDLPMMLINTYLYGVYGRKNKVDILVFEHSRKVKLDNKYIDIYTKKLTEDLEIKNRSYEVIEKPYLRKHFNKADEKKSYWEHYYLANILKRIFTKVELLEQEQEIIEKIESEIKSKFDIEIKILEEIKKSIKIFKLEKEFYKKLLKKREIKKIYLLVSYGWEPLIAACEEQGIETIELQHGTMGKYHLGYSFPHNKKVPYFPDKLQLFGEYWFDNTPLSIERKDIEIIGYPYLEEQLKEYRNLEKKQKQFLFISQGTIGKKLSEIAYKIAKENPNFNIIYKLHPGEYDRWKNDYPILNKANELDNFTVIDNNDTNLYEYMAKSEYLIGVYSTVIFEGLTLDCKTILMNLAGIEYMDYLIENDFVKLAENEKDIVKFIEEDDFKEVDRDYFFKTR